MCGIVGYIGSSNARNIIIEGLEKLEYRGYDSAGITLYNLSSNLFNIYKDIGRVSTLSKTTHNILSNIGIGHTRWATHGKVNAVNAHPHQSSSGRYIIVHNGVIENFKQLKNQYLKNHTFISETDTEVIAHLIDSFSTIMDVEKSIVSTLNLLQGSYALLIIDNKDPNTIYAAKNKPPLIIGKDEEGVTITSDILALAGYAKTYHVLADKTFVVSQKDSVKLYDYDLNEIQVQFEEFNFDIKSSEKGIFEHFMLKEIHEQPTVIRRIMKGYIHDSSININQSLLNDLKQSSRIYILAAGTSMHAGIVGKKIIEDLIKKPVEVHIASEFAYNTPLIDPNAFFILISQSGETADLRTCLTKLKKQDYKTLTITNVITSTLARESLYALEIFAGPEIAVASTKAYVAQIAMLFILAYALSDKAIDIQYELSKTAQAMENFLLSDSHIRDLVVKYINTKHAFYIGRGMDYATSLEAALKLKEISYIHTEGFAAGELKHGTIALIEDKTPVIAIISHESINLNTRSNLEETVSRGAIPIVITLESLKSDGDDIILEDVHPLLTPILTILPAQLIAYYASYELGYDIDKPRNLAKSVTVE
ncbi:Glucosamine--fructose-6-phosphate aminotransferase [isomerizing] [Acholeplasma oculi]|uniref:Glutamine--fructose-6-phosphate aminotransferase [isomerizing] n=1 Tax=Acholeplasma oculi TaxID=35623 RepID=A0A061AAS7_9MOLU|nr:glutamine--fructose-6-phosphate transaminase (isomerizing) [Acholeplasma oculi]CDR30499.1 Glucosamine-fructose-6-phosphate aminotransferase, isomerizing [Acholeplasma oculi]SKC47917.1 glucosamine--fructose-6-phosphate aminotransferase (isomerizing) [Acholeplasma oculi]SUT89136.1 Glucosamine--fructose-6-phosphate aminotransferase [isomerizing] [Acholeplasma oculi]